jgi:hypothetical protein
VPADRSAPSVRGFIEDDDTGPARLAARHRQVLGGASYQVRMTRTVIAGDETRRRMNRSIRVAESGETYHLRQVTTVDESFTATNVTRTRLGVYRSGLTGWFRTVRGNATRYGQLRTSLQGPEVDLTGSDDVERLLRAFGGVSVDTETSPWQTNYRVRALTLTDPAALTLPPGLDSPHEARLTMVVTSEGVVRSYDLTYLARQDREIVRVHQRLAVTGRNTTTVTPPDWVADARAATARPGEGSGGNST